MTRVVWHKKNDLDTSVQATQNISNEHRLGKRFERIVFKAMEFIQQEYLQKQKLEIPY